MARAAMAAAAAAAALLALLLVAAPAAAESPEWAVYRSNLARLPAGANGKATVGDELGGLLDYQFDLPIEFMRRAQARRRTARRQTARPAGGARGPGPEWGAGAGDARLPGC
jgi:hypothetical protein